MKHDTPGKIKAEKRKSPQNLYAKRSGIILNSVRGREGGKKNMMCYHPARENTEMCRTKFLRNAKKIEYKM